MTHPTDDDLDTPRYLIRKHGAYYRPNSEGYTGSAILAGRYTLAEAESITHPNGHDGPRDGMTYIHENDLHDEDWKTYAALRAQLAEVTACNRGLVRLNEATQARVDRAEAALAAQIEDACAVIDAHAEYDQTFCCDGRECGCQGASVHDMMKHFIRQPHDRSALDRMLAEAREKALREAAAGK